MRKESLVAKQYRLHEWAAMIKDCNARSQGVTIQQWCEEHCITRANYYYRLREVRKACLNEISYQNETKEIVPVPMEILNEPESVPANSFLELSVNGISFSITDKTSMQLLEKVLRVVANVK